MVPGPLPPRPKCSPQGTWWVGRGGGWGARAREAGSSCVLQPSTAPQATSRVQESQDFAQSSSSVGGVVCAVQRGCGGRAAKPRGLWGPREHGGGD